MWKNAYRSRIPSFFVLAFDIFSPYLDRYLVLRKSFFQASGSYVLVLYIFLYLSWKNSSLSILSKRLQFSFQLKKFFPQSWCSNAVSQKYTFNQTIFFPSYSEHVFSFEEILIKILVLSTFWSLLWDFIQFLFHRYSISCIFIYLFYLCITVHQVKSCCSLDRRTHEWFMSLGNIYLPDIKIKQMMEWFLFLDLILLYFSEREEKKHLQIDTLVNRNECLSRTV